ncbi:low temperature requirement protein A [Gluconobacter frateurii]|uniref:Low temperature requirement protein LtrA n=1 Tax=Gluconobacter frateurii NRIC 0228 TaxID=1307946 RepID=A0ABQ0Q818_9PROT|nr:low temperature requirement protein A [Gluconobacter frateurii]GBR08403.1 low temperature requirement protein LtrA [Gluconobacter frateurii NRIC 0228]GLP91101.1 membrane protein [Gluconobacter frateurii]
MTTTQSSLMRQPGAQKVKVTNEELFFDLIYVFLVTQVSHGLLHHLTWLGALQMLVLWFAAWLGWQYTGWVTNWFDPRLPALRGTLFGTMALALLCGAALPEAFGERGLAFALCYVVMQVGRSAFVVSRLPFTHPLAANYRRILGWGLIASVFWIAGGLSSPDMRLPLWAMGVLCEYVSPMFGFWLPGLGRSHTSDWTISGSHLVERCQLFVIVALGETVMASGLSMAETSTWSLMELTAFVISFLCTIAMWWLYFETSSEEAEHAISRSSDPGRMGALFHYLHAILIGGIIITAVGMEILLESPLEPAEGASKLVLALGPAFYLLGSSLYHWVSTQKIPALQAGGAVLFSLAAVFVPALPRWELAGAESVVLLAISAFAGGSLKGKFL